MACPQAQGSVLEAVKKGDMQSVKRLLAAGSDVNQEDQEVRLADMNRPTAVCDLPSLHAQTSC